MGINLWGEENCGKFSLTKTEENALRLIKCRENASCVKCKSRIPTKSYCLGGGYYKVCIRCIEPFLNNFVGSLEGYQSQVKLTINEFKAKEQEFIKNNILAKVEDKNE